MILENWSIRKSPISSDRLSGNVFGHPRFTDGVSVTTSTIIGNKDGKIQTRSGSEYELGAVDSRYEELYPGAKERLFSEVVAIDRDKAFQEIIAKNLPDTVTTKVDELKPEHVYDWDEDEFEDIHEAYGELGRGEAEMQALCDIIKAHDDTIRGDDLVDLSDRLATHYELSLS